MTNKLYVSNLAFSMRDAELHEVFSSLGHVVSAKVIIDRFNGRSKGFGFVEMESSELADKAISTLNGAEVAGRIIRVMQANPKPETPASHVPSAPVEHNVSAH